MSVRVRQYQGRDDVWEVDIIFDLPDGTPFRRRLKSPFDTERKSLKWGEEREEFFRNQQREAREARAASGVQVEVKKEVPTAAEFKPRFLDEYGRAERLKPSSIAATDALLRLHVLPVTGAKRLDEVNNEDQQRIKLNMHDRNPKTVNNALSAFNSMLKFAVEMKVIKEVPWNLRLLDLGPRKEIPFLDFDEYARAIAAAKLVGNDALLVVLLGGDAGLRCGEIMALKRTDLDPLRGIHVQRSIWRDHVGSPKGGTDRWVPLTARLGETLRSARHLRGPWVLCQEDGSHLSQKVVQNLARKVARRANLGKEGVHLLRHTFCSHLAMRNVSVTTIQAWAGHKDLKTTMQYMHLSPKLGASAIRCLEEPPPKWWQEATQAETNPVHPADLLGDIVEAAGQPSELVEQ